ncbi:putative selection and upkeep of intraepithelial T-cells protein 1 homolog isoform X4 [Marmota flaviventris]|uniref:putative selection and upkeep of intraepithelial T-cells protein 1 homolog isoform X4 n=1 Tax=Marmota flaviventris TaxID=93162 RepID=UPI003A835867
MIQDSPWEDRGLRPPRMQPWSRSLRTLLLYLLLPWPGAGQFDVIGPSSPVIAKVGAEAVFSCHLNPSTDAQDMEIRWFHAKNSELVHYYRNSQDILEKQHPEYHRRTELLKDQISQGQVALRIHPIRTSDGGDYNCSFASSTHHSAAQFSVEVTASGLDPRIHVEPGPSGRIKLTCMSPGWYPEPEVQWSGPGGLLLEPASETRTIAGDGLFHVESSLSVGENSTGHLTCSIRNPVLDEDKKTHVSMADDLFPRISPWTVVLGVLLSLLTLCLVVTGIVLLRTRKAKALLASDTWCSSDLGPALGDGALLAAPAFSHFEVTLRSRPSAEKDLPHKTSCASAVSCPQWTCRTKLHPGWMQHQP